MGRILSDRTAATIAASLPLMERNRERLASAMSRYMTQRGPSGPAAPAAAALELVDMLVGQLGRDADGESLAGLQRSRRRQRKLALGGEHYAIFGDGLKRAIRDILGDQATPELVAAWSDAYWALVKAAWSPDRAVMRPVSCPLGRPSQAAAAH